jgi:hypothetical protein
VFCAALWLTTHLDGRPRPQNGVYDLGAYEGAWHEALLLLVLRGFQG